MKYTTIKQVARSAALSGLAALVLGCGGGGPPAKASEAGGRGSDRTKLLADQRIFIEDPDVWINDVQLFPDFEVEVSSGDFRPEGNEIIGRCRKQDSRGRLVHSHNIYRGDPRFAYVEYTSPTDNSQTARAEIQLFYDNGIDYLYRGPAPLSVVRSSLEEYSNAGYAGFVPEP